MIVDSEKIKERAVLLAQTAAPVIQAAGEALSPVLQVIGDQFKRAAEQARQLLDMFAVVLPPRRPPARKPCAWCTDRVKRPATHVVKWHKTVVWEDEYNQDGTVIQPGGRRQQMCEFHAKLAARYSGVKTYRFRRV